MNTPCESRWERNLVMSANETEQNNEATIDKTLADTFPASDPPSWTLGREPHPAVSLQSGSSPTQSQKATKVTMLFCWLRSDNESGCARAAGDHSLW